MRHGSNYLPAHARRQTAAALLSFVGDTLVTSTGVYIDNIGMIEKAQLDSYRALAAKPGHDSVDASKALVALPALLAEVDELRALLVEMAEIAEDGLSSTLWVSPDRSGDLNELKARAGL